MASKRADDTGQYTNIQTDKQTNKFQRIDVVGTSKLMQLLELLSEMKSLLNGHIDIIEI
jgi:hypothetical protein